MNGLWQKYSERFLDLSSREQYLIIITGMIVIVLLVFTGKIDSQLIESEKLDRKINQTTQDNSNKQATVNVLEQSLKSDVNQTFTKKITSLKKSSLTLDGDLLALTSGLIDPMQMRYALTDLLQLQNSISLSSFEVLPAAPLNLKQQANDASKQPTTNALTLYKHTVKLVLKGNYFQLRDYLASLEQLEWRFFWRSFDYRMIDYPAGELHIELYSLSTKKEFLGV